jgi:TonB family protein
LKDIQSGEQTVLNTREFRYYTYYSRIRRQLSHHWEPKVKEKLSRIFRQGRRIASDKDHITKLLIILNPQGELVKVQVVGASGVHDLDDAATEAFRSAAPFPNPPAGIVESDGYVKIRWDFVLES